MLLLAIIVSTFSLIIVLSSLACAVSKIEG